jgi:hypothetical protein
MNINNTQSSLLINEINTPTEESEDNDWILGIDFSPPVSPPLTGQKRRLSPSPEDETVSKISRVAESHFNETPICSKEELLLDAIDKAALAGDRQAVFSLINQDPERAEIRRSIAVQRNLYEGNKAAILLILSENPAFANDYLTIAYEETIDYSGVADNFHHLFGDYIQLLQELVAWKQEARNEQQYIQREKACKTMGQCYLLKEPSLDLSCAELTTLPECIRYLSHLTQLDIACNPLTSLPDGIRWLTNLDHFKLENLRISQLPDWIGELTALKLLNLANNEISTLPEGMRNLKALETFCWDAPDSESETFTENPCLTQIPDVVRSLKSLKTLTLKCHKLNELPPWIGELTLLESLDVQDNQLTHLPKTISRLNHLQTLHVNGNLLSRIPLDLARTLSAECQIDASSNPLLPDGIENFNKAAGTARANNQALGPHLEAWMVDDNDPANHPDLSECLETETYQCEATRNQVISKIGRILQEVCENGAFLQEFFNCLQKNLNEQPDQAAILFEQLDALRLIYHTPKTQKEYRELLRGPDRHHAIREIGRRQFAKEA